MQGWNVYLSRKLIDTVFYTKGIKGEEVRISLIEHDGYPSNIRVSKA